MMRLTISTPADFSFLETLNAHGWRRLLPFTADDDAGTLERVEQMVDGRVVLLTMRGDGNTIATEVSEDAEPDEIGGLVRRMLQLDLPIADFHAYAAEQPKLRHVPQRGQGRLLRAPTVWEDTVKVICTTNTTWTQTKAMTQRIVDAYGAPLPADPTRRAFPTPQQIADVSLEEFSATARLGYRNAAVYGLATDLAAGTLDLESLRADPATLPTADLRARLLALRGVGPYAAACLMLYMGRYDRVNVDSWARTLVGKELGRAVTDREVHEFFAEYAPFQALAYHFYPWRIDTTE